MSRPEILQAAIDEAEHTISELYGVYGSAFAENAPAVRQRLGYAATLVWSAYDNISQARGLDDRHLQILRSLYDRLSSLSHTDPQDLTEVANVISQTIALFDMFISQHAAPKP